MNDDAEPCRLCGHETWNEDRLCNDCQFMLASVKVDGV